MATSVADSDPLIAVPLSVGVGVAAAAARLAASYVANPTGPAYMARYVAHTPTLRRVEEVVEVGPLAAAAIEQLATLGFAEPITLVDRDGAALLHVVSAREKRVCAVVTDATGTTTVHSRLTDGRVLTTATGLLAPSDELVVNPCDGSGAVAVVRRHAQVLRLMFETRLDEADPVELAVAALAAERRGWAAIGRGRAALAHVAGRRGIIRVHASVPDASLLVASALSAAAPLMAATDDLTAAMVLPVAAPHRQACGETSPRRPLQMWEDPPMVPIGRGLRELEPQGV